MMTGDPTGGLIKTHGDPTGGMGYVPGDPGGGFCGDPTGGIYGWLELLLQFIVW